MGIRFKIEKVDWLKYDPNKLIQKMMETKNFSEYLLKTTYPEYLNWKKVKYRKIPPNMTPEEFWAIIKLLRTSPLSKKQSFVKEESGEYFTWQSLPGSESFYHNVDRELGGNLYVSERFDKKDQHHFVSRGVMEEAIASSQLEGAETTRRVAKQMIREKREPKNKWERMIYNNYVTMKAIEEEYRDTELTEELLCQLQSMLTTDTDLPEDCMGRYRTDKDDIVITAKGKNIDYHVPPKENFLKKEIKKLVQYFNDKLQDPIFIHPLTKAIIIHFWIGYLHPFCDGNGRLARILFYWYLIKNDYWAFTFLPLSKVIRNSPAQYRDAYIYTEQDDFDLTYFIDYNVRKIKQAKSDFEKFLEKYKKINQKMVEIARSDFKLNNRQVQTLKYLHKNTNETTSVSSYSTIYDLSRMTATKDLKSLESDGFLTSKKIGKYVHYYATEKVNELFE